MSLNTDNYHMEAVLVELLKQLSRYNEDSNLSTRDAREIFMPDFDPLDLAGLSGESFSNWRIVPITDQFIAAYLFGNSDLPYKLELNFRNNWKIKSIKSLCQGCFGEDLSCDVCGGSGWGAL